MNPIAYLEKNDSYHFFESLEDLIRTGPTHTNVMNIILITFWP
jgi:glycerate-2-kinase